MNNCGALIILSFLVLCHHLTDGLTAFTGDPLFVGCFKDFMAKTQRSTTNTINECLTICTQQLHFLAALKGNSDCYCGDNTKNRVPSNKCNTACFGNDGICGGDNYFAVYTAVPTYIGCFKDTPDRDFDGHIFKENINIQTCLNNCRSKYALYAAAQYTSECFCGKSYGKYGNVPDSECNMACSADTKTACGSGYKNSVYSVGIIPGLKLYLTDVFHCAQGSDVFGVCTNNDCLTGWKGKKCNQRDCAVANGNCGAKNQCVEHMIANHIATECVCGSGFTSTPWIYNECEDMDDCKSFLCKIDLQVIFLYEHLSRDFDD